MNRTRLLTDCVLLLCTNLAAAAPAAPQADPGLITADSPLYGLDVAADRAAMTVGLQPPGTVAEERASELAVATRQNNSQAAQQARTQLTQVAAAATQNSTGLQQAVQILETVQEQVPAVADTGLQSALDAVQQAQQRVMAGGGQRGGR